MKPSGTRRISEALLLGISECSLKWQAKSTAHFGLLSLFSVFYDVIFTNKMTRFRIETGPQPSAMETSLREES
ncbi:hypothetical protein ALC53_11932 [Atta colombica]|uniref:Uncharacterized protein n=1 Tax=Atta colombica TaxID=520822 RepID=A0A195AZG1_9HYME|nr:hypothetical protein ALC53_11932 [Atta colombica]